MDAKKFSMNYGAFLGLCLVAVAVLLDAFGIDEQESIVPAFFNSLIIIVGLSYSITQFRDTISGGFISYSSSLKLGTTVAFFSSIILAFYTFINVSYINPDFIPNLLLETEQAILQSNPEISDEDLDMSMKMTAKMMQPHWMLIMGMLGGTFMGFIYSAIISIFVKNPDPNKIV